MKNILKSLIILPYIIILFSFFGEYNYFCDLLSHFYLQYFIVTFIVLIINIILKFKKGIILSLLLLIYLGFFISKSTLSHGKYSGDIEHYFLNAHIKNTNVDYIVQDIKKYNPKYLSVVELNEQLYKNIIDKLGYKNVLYYNNGVYSFGFFTNEEILEKEIIVEEYPIGYIKLSNINVYIIHPLPPMSNEYYNKQKKLFSIINDKTKNDINNGRDFLVLGDFNSTYYSSVFKKYFGKYNYIPVYSWNIEGFLRIPIDYAISNIGLTVKGGNSVYSDHIPLLINIIKK